MANDVILSPFDNGTPVQIHKSEVPEAAWDNPANKWYDEDQSGTTVPTHAKAGARWGHGILCVFPDGTCSWWSTDWDSSG